MKLVVQNLAVEYEDFGKGPVMLFLHGWQDDLHTFDALFPLLSPPWRIIALDLPGFGKSEMPKRAWRLSDFVSFVSAFLQKLDISPHVIIGHSFGGRVIIKGVAAKTFDPHKIILIAAAGRAKTRTARSLLFATVAKVGNIVTCIPPLYFWRNTLRKKLYMRAQSDYLAAGPLKETFLNIIREDLMAEVRNISVPTLLLWGSLDTQTPLSDGKTFARLIPGATLEVYKGAGHFVHRERTHEVAQSIKNFVKQS